MSSMLLAEMRRKRFNARAQSPGEPAVILPKGVVLTADVAPGQPGYGMQLMAVGDLIKIVEGYLRT